MAWQLITHHTGFATFVPIFHEICSTYSFTAVHLLKRIFGTNILEICIHISVLCRCIHTKGYWMHTYTKYAPIYPPLRMYSYEGCLVQTYSKYAHTFTNCVLYRIIEHQGQLQNTKCKCLQISIVYSEYFMFHCMCLKSVLGSHHHISPCTKATMILMNKQVCLTVG